MLQDNIIAQVCAIFGALFMGFAFVISFRRNTEVSVNDNELNPNLPRLVILVIFIGLLRGAL